MESLFSLENGKYLPTDWARGPWDLRHLHGAASAALLAHALEFERRDPALWTTRITFDLLRPVRQTPLTTQTQLIRAGKRIRLVDAFLYDHDILVARASALMLRRDVTTEPPLPTQPLMPTWENLGRHEIVWGGEPRRFHRRTEFRPLPRIQPGQRYATWVRIPYMLLPDKPLTPLELAAAVSDHVNAVGTFAYPGHSPFINADITLNLHREPEGEWLCLESVGRPDRDGIAVSSANIHDVAGPLGSVSACCLAVPLPKDVAG